MAKKFEIGLCMAGAVSAGAYTAGVMDYLLEALGEWERQRGKEGIPSHEVCIPFIGGASAGGMTALLTASTVNNPLKPVGFPERARLLDKHPENKLYHSWVDLTAHDMFPKMLDTSDIKGGTVVSLLNSEFIDEVANNMLCCDVNKWQETPSFLKGRSGDSLKIFTTLTNLGGFHYYTGLNSSNPDENYYMRVHNDYACFEMSDAAVPAAGKNWIPLNFRTGDNLELAREAAMATGAFPLGLAPRRLTRKAEYVQQIPWLEFIFRDSAALEESITTLNIDGGVINNEPFEKVRDLLNGNTAKEQDLPFATAAERFNTCLQLEDFNCSYNSFENTMLMIDPFPSVKSTGFSTENRGLGTVVQYTLSSMLSQMRAKPQEYKSAVRESDASKYIISPSREIRDGEGNVLEKLYGEKAIACGTLGGFGGFLSKEFRIHDFYLGRYNCEIFLRDYFTVPESALKNNPIFRDGYKDVWDKDRERFTVKHPDREKRYQIIPILTPRSSAFKVPVFSGGTTWPVLPESEIDRFDSGIRKRAEKIIMNSMQLKGLARPLMYIGAKVIINKLVAAKTTGIIKDSLAKWKLLKQ